LRKKRKASQNQLAKRRKKDLQKKAKRAKKKKTKVVQKIYVESYDIP
jgi:hypothetical protein